MRSWFFVRDGKQHGPVPEDDLHEMLASGALSPDALVWTADMNEWRPAKQVEGLMLRGSGPPPFPPPLIRESTAFLPTDGYQPSGTQARPWVRFWARLTDNLLFSFVISIVLGIVNEPLPKINPTLLGIVTLFIYIFVEATMLSSWGTTPGKALLRVRLRRPDGRKLSFSQGLKRAFQVWVLGEGIGFPIAAVVTGIIAHRRLRRKGKTSWDEEGRFAYSHRIVGPWRTVLTILIPVCIVALSVWGKLASR